VGGGLIVVNGMPESPWFDPVETAARELGAPYSIGEIYAFEAFRTGLYARRLPITMIFGLDRTVAEGLRGTLADGPCGCGRAGQRVTLSEGE